MQKMDFFLCFKRQGNAKLTLCAKLLLIPSTLLKFQRSWFRADSQWNHNQHSNLPFCPFL